LTRVSARPLTDLVEAEWAVALEPVGRQVARMGEFLRAEIDAGRGYLPPGPDVLRAFTFPMAQVKVLIVQQAPLAARALCEPEENLSCVQDKTWILVGM
jgi:uracil-DNA glycosylase